MGLRNAANEELGSAFQRLYGCSARLPGDYLEPTTLIPLHFTPLKQIQATVRHLPRSDSTYMRKSCHMDKHLLNCTHVWILKPTHRGLESAYEGPFEVLKRDPTMKTVSVNIDGMPKNISIDRLKPAWFWSSNIIN